MTTYQHRRNFLPTLVIGLVLWILAGLTVMFVSPNFNWPWMLVLLGVNLWLATGLTASLLIGNSKTGFLLATTVVMVLLLRVLL